MGGKLLFYMTVTLFICTQFSLGDSRHNPKYPEFHEYVNVSGIEYYITTGSLLWADAYNDCLYRNMKLISFENPGEYEEFAAWLNDTEFNWRWFWTSGLKERDTDTWRWMPSEKEITDFFWAPNQPDLESSYDTCLTFYPGEGGMADMDCLFNQLAHVCKPISN